MALASDNAMRFGPMTNGLMASEQVERVEAAASAIFATRFCGRPPFGDNPEREWADLAEEVRELWRIYARAAIDALDKFEGQALAKADAVLTATEKTNGS